MTDEKRIRSFEDLIAEEGLLPLARTVDLVVQIAEAIAAMAADGCVIDSLEPRAILVTDELVPGTPGATRTRVLGIRRSDDLPVRPGGPRASYFAPEDHDQPTGHAVAQPAHQFSLAAIAYEMLAGCPAYPEEIGDVTTVGEPDGKGWSRPMPPPVSEQVMGVSSGLDQVLRRALSSEPGERYAGIDDFVAALREVSDPGAVWDDGATVIWSPAAGDMEPAVSLPPIDERGPWLQPRPRTTAKIRSLRLAGAAHFIKSKADALLGRNRDPSLKALMRKSRSTPPHGAVVASLSASGPATSMAFASFPAGGMPSRRTQMMFLGAAVVLVLGAVAVMSGSRSKPVTDSAAESTVAEPEPTIHPRPRIVEARPLARPTLAQSAVVAGTSRSAGATAAVAASEAPRHTAKPARGHSRHGAHRQITARR